MIFVGDDWAEADHDVHVMDEGGQRLTSRRLPEGLAGIRAFHELVAEHASDATNVVVGIETDRGLWVHALTAAGYEVLRSTPWRCPAIGTGTTWLAPSRIRGMRECWRIWSAPTGTTTGP